MNNKPVWYSHAKEDTIDKVDMELVKVPFTVNAVSILRLCNNLIYPFEFITIADLIIKTLNALHAEAKNIINLSNLINQAEALRTKIKALNKSIDKNISNVNPNNLKSAAKEKFKNINLCFIELSRNLLPALSSKSGKYKQDPMGSKFIPLFSLHQVSRLSSMDAGSEDYRALYTSLLRERNYFSDTFKNSCRMIDSTLEKI